MLQTFQWIYVDAYVLNCHTDPKFFRSILKTFLGNPLSNEMAP